MFHKKVFIVKFSSINGLSTSSIEIFKISSLEHKLRNDSVENGICVSKPILVLTRGDAVEVPGGYGNNFIEKFHVNLSIVLVID